MKKIFFLVAVMTSAFAAQAQGIDFGVKAGANFSNLDANIDTDGITSYHAGAVLELSLIPTFSVQAEGIFSSQGAEYKNALGAVEDINLDYISMPVMAKFYLLPDRLSLMAGPQFSFLIDENKEALESKDFDMAAAGGVELKIIGGLFAQARYTIGLTKVNDAIDAKNAVFQLSVGYLFF
ncbi:MAG: hypothetical protein BM557_01920 [Flavobacterium sp. MedPE-SWcel]|uniref:porin family protein n=1 Tax=uncultured Flavobacterium sp. TaxID=165435 RepID=UPI0009210FC7|nr:porin family protein [uncultured Flavobacterium sp.]OIQ22155.1 MAG: hypothetical protein BM557_01920 [Flavobacterium sp. MedPE-SWcel]